MLPTSLPIDSGAWRWQQRSSSATGVPSSRRNSSTGSSMMTRRRISRVTSWSQAATYHALRTYIDPPCAQFESDECGAEDQAGQVQPAIDGSGFKRQQQKHATGNEAEPGSPGQDAGEV